MSSFCTAKATHIFFSKKFQHICVSLDVNFNESLTNDVVSFEHPGPEFLAPPSFMGNNSWSQKKNYESLRHNLQYLHFKRQILRILFDNASELNLPNRCPER